MKPILYDSISLEGLGLGTMADAISCEVKHEINGVYDLKMTYPVTGVHFDELENGRILKAKPDILSDDQAFRIYRITKPLNGVVTVHAHHIAYDMSGYIVTPFSASNLTDALTLAINRAVPSCPFSLSSPRVVASAMSVKEPVPLWQLLGGSRESFLDIYGGEWDFNNFSATLRTQLGTDRGVSVRYAKNMTDLEQDASLEATYKGVFPYWYDEDSDTLVKLTENYITIPTGVGDRIMVLDLSGEWEEAPTEAELRTRAQKYIDDNKVGEPKVTWKVRFVNLADSEEFRDAAVLEHVMLGDTVTVVYEELGVNASSRVVKTEFDVLNEKYTAVTLGRVKQNLAKILAGTKGEIDDAIATAKVGLERAIDSATDFITNGSGYMRFIYDGEVLKEIVSLDNPDINQARSVWRWNNGGFGHSSSGYNGPYTAAITQDGSIVADFITTGQLNVNNVRVIGTLSDINGNNSWNMATGEFIIRNGKINISTGSSTDDYIVLDGNTTQTHVSSRYLGVWNKSNDANPNTRIQIAGAAINMQSSSDGTNWVRRALISDDYMWHFSDTGKPVSKIGAYSSSSPFGQVYLYDQDGNLRQYQDYSGIKFADTSGNLTNFVAPSGIWFPLGDIPYSAAITAIVNKVLDQPGDGVWQIAGTWINHVNGYSGIVSMQSYGPAWSASKILFGIIATSSSTNGGVWAWSGLSGAGIYIWPLHT